MPGERRRDLRGPTPSVSMLPECVRVGPPRDDRAEGAPTRHAADAPYAIAVVKLREGVSLIGRIVDIPLDRLEIGLPVRFRPLVTDAQTSVGFGPA